MGRQDFYRYVYKNASLVEPGQFAQTSFAWQVTLHLHLRPSLRSLDYNIDSGGKKENSLTTKILLLLQELKIYPC